MRGWVSTLGRLSIVVLPLAGPLFSIIDVEIPDRSPAFCTNVARVDPLAQRGDADPDERRDF